MPFNVSEVMDGSAALLNDAAKTVFTYVAQLPYFKIALEDLRQELMDNNIPISTKLSANITVPVGTNNIGGTTLLGYSVVGPALPVDLVEIIALWERTSGSVDGYSFIEKRPFVNKDIISSQHPQEWAWSNQVITFAPATVALQMVIDYIGDPLAAIVDETSTVRVYNSTNFLKYRNAALCAEYIGENPERAASLNANALRAIEVLLNISIKGSQNLSTRRRAYRGHI